MDKSKKTKTIDLQNNKEFLENMDLLLNMDVLESANYWDIIESGAKGDTAIDWDTSSDVNLTEEDEK